MKKNKITSVILPFIIIFLTGCIDLPTTWKMPNWDVDLNVPIVNRSYTLSDIVKEQKYISVQPTASGGSIYLIQSDKYDQSVGMSKFIQVTTATTISNQPVPVINKDTTFTLYLPIPEGAELDSAKFISGSFSFNFTNPNPFDVNFTLTIPGIILPNNSVFSITALLPALGNNSYNYDFGNDTYRLPANQRTINRDKIQLIVSSKPNSSLFPFGLPLTMNFTSSNFYFSYVSGYLPRKSLGTETNSFNLNIGNVLDYRNKVTLKDANLHLTANYISIAKNPFEIEVNNFNIIGKTSSGAVLKTLTDKSGNPFTIRFQNGKLDTTFNNANSSITDFMSSLPDQVVLTAEYIVNPDDIHTPGAATINDSVKFSADFSTTSNLSINNASITDTQNVDISSDNRNSIAKGQSVSLTIDIQNGIPLTGSVKVTLADSLYRPLFTLTDINGNDSFSFAGASIDQNGEVSKTTPTIKTVALDSSQIQLLSRAYYAFYTVVTSSTNINNNPPPTVLIRPEDQISIKSYGSVRYRVKPN